MAKPKIFISSTFYDLKHIRASMEEFIDNLGYEAVLSEKGNIAYDPSLPLDESCYREAKNSDILVLIIGGRYGSVASAEARETPDDFFDRYASITKKEYESAIELNTPVYILIDRSVYTEYQTFKKNRNAKNVIYAHVDSINVFLLIDQILGQARNNPIHQFEHQSEITSWLREQWGGLFKELLIGRTEQHQLSSLADQVKGLEDINTTFKRYLEEIISRVTDNGKAEELIDSEGERLEESRRTMQFSKHNWIKLIMARGNISLGDTKRIFSEATSIEGIIMKLCKIDPQGFQFDDLMESWKGDAISGDGTFGEEKVTQLRAIIGLPPISFYDSSQQE